jgi:DNA polymerase III subunit epsilon
MREVILDCETTGFSPSDGDRLVEIACIELVDRRQTGRRFHSYVNPERQVPPAATKVHGITNLFLRDKPRFSAIAGKLDAFLAGANLIAHNAPFDAAFVNAEFRLIGHAGFDWNLWIDTNAIAQKQFGRAKGRTTLDALCTRFGLDRSKREKHGAMTDTELLVEVYLALTYGANQGALDLAPPAAAVIARPDYSNRPPRKSLITPEEFEAWKAFIATIPDAIGPLDLTDKREAA